MHEDCQTLDDKAKLALEKFREIQTPSLKDKLALEPQKAYELDALERKTSMAETTLGFTENQAKLEASRCMKCKKPFCSAACPIGMPIPQYLEFVAEGDFESAITLIRKTSLFPSICSRVCPHERQCQSNCAVGKSLKDRKKGLSLGNLERFCADYERIHQGARKVSPKENPTGKKVAIVGGGPAGLAAAIDLSTLGHTVVIFESAEKLGGVLRYGIPEFRLPKHILDYELSIIEKLNIEVRTGIRIGRDKMLSDLLEKENFDAAFIACGASLALTAKTVGENLPGIFTAETYLRAGNLGEKIDSGRDVIIIGGGNVAMDASRMAFRLGASRVRIVYRRTREQMPACDAEIEEALAEGVEIVELRNPAEFLPNDSGRVATVKLDVFKLGEPDAKGRPRPVKQEGLSETIECDTVVIAIGSAVSKEAASGTELSLNENGTFVIVDENSGKTELEKVFVGGDAKHGPQTVVLAMKSGRMAAQAIHEKLVGKISEL